MDFQAEYRSKLRTPAEAVAFLYCVPQMAAPAEGPHFFVCFP